MALPVANLTQDSLEQLYGVFSDDKTLVGCRQGVDKLNELTGLLNRIYSTVVVADITQTDSDDAGVSEFITAEATISVGSVYRKLGSAGTEDLTDNVIATAKGSTLVSGDVFVIDGADSIKYLGTQLVADVATGDVKAFDFSGEKRSDFVSIGS